MDKLTDLKAVTDEIIGAEELEILVTSGEKINHYIGFEISGLVHLGTGLMSGLVIRELQKLGVNTSFFLADWHTWINNKLGGNMELIEQVAKEYFLPALKVSAQIAGADPEKINSNFGSELYHENDRYWQTMVEVSKSLTLSRVLKSTTILGRQESDSMNFAYLVYPPMQVADIYEMECKIAHAGMDQRKCHVIAREVAEKLQVHPLTDAKGNKLKPIAVHHHLLLGLQKPATWPLPEGEEKDTIRSQMKMSKSIPGSAIFIHDSEEEIQDKLRKAFCPEKEIEYNPVLDWVKYMLFPILGEMNFVREERFGGNFTVKSYQELEERYASGDLFPLDLKQNVANILTELLAPARALFANTQAQNLISTIKENQSR